MNLTATVVNALQGGELSVALGTEVTSVAVVDARANITVSIRIIDSYAKNINLNMFV